MLSKKFRLPPRETFTGARVISTPSLIIKLKSQDLGYSRLGFVISKKVDKRAVVRNKIRRVLSSVIQEEGLLAEKSYDMLIIVKKQLGHKSAVEELKSIAFKGE